MTSKVKGQGHKLIYTSHHSLFLIRETKCCTCAIRGERGHTVSAEPGGHTSFWIGVVCLSACLSACHFECMQDSSWTRFRMSTKHGKHGQEVDEPLWVMKFRCWSEPGCGSTITFLLPLTSQDTAWYDYILTRQTAPPRFSATLHRPCLGGVCALSAVLLVQGRLILTTQAWKQTLPPSDRMMYTIGAVSGSRVLYPNFLLDSWKSHFRW